MNRETAQTPARPDGSEPTPAHGPTLPRGVIGVLLAVMLAGGMVTGAVLGPASASPLLSNTEIIQRALALIEAGASGTARPSASPSPTPQAPSATENAAPRAPASAKGSRASASQSLAPSPSSSESGASEKSTSEGSGEGKEAASGRPPRLPPIQHVWLVVLDGSTFAAATAAASGYPYLVGQLIKQGTLLTSYSALDGYELAGDAALLPGGIGASVRPISEPGCGSSPATGTGASCAPGAQRTPAEADAFAQRLVGPILSSPAYRENGLVVITFAPASEEAGVPVSTLALQPTAGALLLSPLLHEGARSATPFNPISPRTSLETVFGH
jgi:hypothetical protein